MGWQDDKSGTTKFHCCTYFPVLQVIVESYMGANLFTSCETPRVQSLFLMLSCYLLPLLLCLAPCSTHFWLLLKERWWTDQPLQLEVQGMAREKSYQDATEIKSRNSEHTNWVQNCLYSVQREDKRHQKKQWVRRTYGMHTPEQHIKSCYGVLGKQNSSQHPRLLGFQNWARED